MKNVKIIFLLITVTLSFVTSCTKDLTEDNIIKDDLNSITSFEFRATDNANLSKDYVGKIDEDNKTISVEVPYRTDITSLKPIIRTSEKATISGEFTAAKNFENPVEYVVTSESGQSAVYKVVVRVLNPTDQEVLMEIQKANPWIWDADENIQTWQGVHFNDQNRLDSLAFYYSGVESFPKEIKFLSELKSLKIEYNSGMDYLPDEIGDLENLEELILYECQVYEIPETLSKLSKLKKLDITATFIEKLPEAVWDLKNLKSLRVDNSNLNKISDKIKNLENLEYLSLHQISYPPTTTIFSLPNLKTLELKLKDFQSTYWTYLESPSPIENLDLSSNKIIELPVELSQFRNLKKLDLGSVSLKELPFWISQLEDLRYLDIKNNPDLSYIPKILCEKAENGLLLLEKDDDVLCE